MRTRILVGVVFLTALMCSTLAYAQSDADESLESFGPPKLGISGEKISIERQGGVAKLFWSGWIVLVKPSEAPVTVSLRCLLEPSGKWRTRPRNLLTPQSYAEGVNSSFHKVELAEVDLSEDTGARDLPPLRSLFTKEQVISLKLSLRQQRSSLASPTLEEREYRLSPLGYALMDAAYNGDLAEVGALLDEGVPPDSADLQGWNPLMSACVQGHLDIARLLVKHNANLVAQTKGFAFSESANGSPIPGGTTPLLAAAYSGRLELVRFLLDEGAAYGDYVRRVKNYGANDGELVDLLTETGVKRQEAIDQMVKQGAQRKDIDALLHKGGFADIVWRLSKRGFMYTGIAARLKQSGATDEVIASRLRKKGATDEDIRKAVEGKWLTDDAIRQTLFDKGATKEETNAMVNERKLAEDAVRACLKENGVRPQEIDALVRERTPDDEAIRAFLREKGVPVEDIDNCLCERGALPRDIVGFLSRHGGTVDALRADGWTPLLAASYKGNPQLVRFLIDEGANPLLKDAQGYSPLALAYINGNRGAYSILKSRGASIQVPWNPSSGE